MNGQKLKLFSSIPENDQKIKGASVSKAEKVASAEKFWKKRELGGCEFSVSGIFVLFALKTFFGFLPLARQTIPETRMALWE